MTLRFSPGNHQYWLDGQRISGVTTLLKKGLPKPALTYWAARTVAEYVADNPDDVEVLRRAGRGPMVAALKEIPWQKRDDAAARGTDVHALAERVVHGEQVDVPAHLVGHVEGHARFLDTFGVEPLLTEARCAHRTHWWAGTLDAVVTISGEVWLLDWKTSSGVYGETALQAAAYASAEFHAPEPDVEVPMPFVQRTGVVHVTADGSHLYPLAKDPGEIAEAYAAFRHIAWVAGKTEWIKGLVGDPMAPESVEVS